MKKIKIAFLFLFLCLFNCASSIKSTNQSIPNILMDSSVTYSPITLIGLPDTPLINQPTTLTLSNSNEEFITPLRTNERAPYSGVLFNNAAVARISVEYTGVQERCLIDRQHAFDSVAARYNADVNTLQLAIQARERANLVLISSRDNEITRLQGLVETQRRQNNGPHVGEGLVWAGGGLLLGVLIAGGIALGVTAH